MSLKQKHPNKKHLNKKQTIYILFCVLVIGGYYYIDSDKVSNKSSDQSSDKVFNHLIQNPQIASKSGLEINKDAQKLNTKKSVKKKKSIDRHPSSEGEVYELEDDYLSSSREVNAPPVASSADIQSVAEDLDLQSTENNVYESPEAIVRRRLLIRSLKNNYLKNEDEIDRKEFVTQFIQIAKEQGYKVHFLKNGKVTLEPMDLDQPPNSSENVEKIKVRW